jgi:cytosine/uracil/thiamine/allantoin permease
MSSPCIIYCPFTKVFADFLLHYYLLIRSLKNATNQMLKTMILLEIIGFILVWLIGLRAITGGYDDINR